MENNNTPVREIKHSLIPCRFGAHRYEVYADELMKTINGTIVGRNIITRCSICGKIKSNPIKIITTNEFI